MDKKSPRSMTERLQEEFPELWIVLQICKEAGADPKLINLTMDGVVVRGNDSSAH